MKFQTNDILENRHGIQVIIINADPVAKEYSYQYLAISSPQFQGTFCHSSDDIERFWNLVPRSQHQASMYDPSSLDEFQAKSRLNRPGQKCVHNLAEYVGFSEKYKYCTKCDEKF